MSTPPTAVLMTMLLGAWLVAPAAGLAQEAPEKMGVAVVEKLIAGQFSEIVAAFSRRTLRRPDSFQQSNRIKKRRIFMSSGKLPQFVVDRLDCNAMFVGRVLISERRNSDRSDNKLLNIGLKD